MIKTVNGRVYSKTENGQIVKTEYLEAEFDNKISYDFTTTIGPVSEIFPDFFKGDEE